MCDLARSQFKPSTSAQKWSLVELAFKKLLHPPSIKSVRKAPRERQFLNKLYSLTGVDIKVIRIRAQLSMNQRSTI
jgi:hypothetical protein